MLIQKKELSKIGRGAPGAPRVEVDASVCARVTMEPTGPCDQDPNSIGNVSS